MVVYDQQRGRLRAAEPGEDEAALNAFWVIEYLRNHPQGAEPAELADRINVMRQLTTIILNDLEKRGFLLRRESAQDHRRRIIQLLPRGEEFAAEVCDAMEQFDLESLSAFTPKEQERMVEDSRRFCNALKSAARKHPSPSRNC